MSKRNYNIYKKKSRMWTCEVTDYYGNVSTNYFKTKEDCMKQVYYIWENEEHFHNQDGMELLNNAIAECIQMDIDRGVEPNLD